ncbi:MAG: transporter substrate-binding domain-containing protein [Clostridia bacterium]|nr:transporter substrate-binding domain-containing protein [Clostridia bacterium]
MKKLLALILALVMMLSLAACGGTQAPANDNSSANAESDLAYITGNGKMIIGYTVYEPMNYTDDSGKFVGFDTEYAEAVCAELGVDPEFVEINWDTKEIELDAKNIDCIWNGFTITEERKQNIEFTKPYITNKQVVVIKAENAEKYTDTASLSSANLVAEIESAGEGAIADDENLKNANYVAVAKQTDGLLEVKSGTADAVVLDYTLASAMVGEGTDYADLMIIDGLDLQVEEYGIGFRKGSDAAAKVDEITAKLLADGTLDEIAAKYELSAILTK